MATVGDTLTAPESGWQRFGSSDSRFSYSGTVNTNTGTSYYQGSQKAIGTNGKITFKFVGTKLRIITDAYTSNHSTNVQVTVDGNVSNISTCAAGNYQRLSYEKTGLASQTHLVEIVNLDNYGFGFGAIDIDDTGELLTPITAPTNLTAIAGDSKVTLSWDAVTGATGYNVKRATTAGGPYTTIASNVSGTSYIDTSVINGTTYYYVVTAVDATGESTNSNEASATPQAPSGHGLLRITMNDSSEREYQLTDSEIAQFIEWCNRTVGTGNAYYVFNKDYNVGDFKIRKEYLMFEKIISFEVMELTK